MSQFNALPVFVKAGETISGVDARLSLGGSISGEVVDPSNNGINRVEVIAYCDSYVNGWIPYISYSNPKGDYLVDMLPAGNYRVVFLPPDQYAEEWYNKQVSKGSADVVSVSEGQVTSGINAQLSSGGVISGKVTDSNGNGIGSINVNVYDLNKNVVDWRWTDGSGNYSIPSLLAGTYKVYFDKTKYTPNFAPEWYSDKSSFEKADVVSVTGGATTSGINAQLSTGSITTPDIPGGPTMGIVGVYYFFTSGGSTSNLGDAIDYQFDWKGDTSDLSAWGPSTQSKAWNSAGVYGVRARARCSTNTSVVSDWSNPLSVSISIPKISVAPTAYDFGNVKPKRSKAGSLVVKNSGTANLLISTLIRGTDTSMFTITSGGGNKIIKPGKSLTIKITFKPTSTGSKSSNLEITSNDPVTPITEIPLAGNLEQSCDYPLNVNVNPLGAGAVSETPSKNAYCAMERVTLTATANSGYSFKSWSGVDSSNGSTAYVTMNGVRTITANFSPSCTYTLSVGINPSGSATVTRNPDKATYCVGEQVTLGAVPNSGYTFSSWSGVDSSNGTTAYVTMNSNRSVMVNFVCGAQSLPDVPALISPENKSVFNCYPRATTLKWNASGGMQPITYSVEVQYTSCTGSDEFGSWVEGCYALFASASKELSATEYTFDFVGAQPGRWRVKAKNACAESEWSDWWYFRYTQ